MKVSVQKAVHCFAVCTVFVKAQKNGLSLGISLLDELKSNKICHCCQ